MTTSNPITRRDLGTLRTAVTGDVFAPGEVGYDEARRAWNLTTDERPAVVVVAGSAAGVVHAVRFARSRGMRIARRAPVTVPSRSSRCSVPPPDLGGVGPGR
jgi:hypothetical protein